MLPKGLGLGKEQEGSEDSGVAKKKKVLMFLEKPKNFLLPKN